MRLAWLVALLLAPVTVLASGPSTVLLEWESGAFAAGAPAAVEPANARTFPMAVDGCHRRVLVDLLYDPVETLLVQGGGVEVALLHVFRVDVRAPGGALVASSTVRSSGYGFVLGTLPAGDYDARVHLTQGANVSWAMRMRGWEVPDEPECLPRVVVSEVEANPPGPDAGHEWVELLNLEAVEVDLSGWTVAGTHGEPGELTLPEGSVVPAGGRLVVTFPSQAIDNANEIVELRRLSVVRDRTPVLRDVADDARTWQRGEPWTFAPGTPGE